MSIQVPVTSQAANSAVVPDAQVLSDALQLALYQLGDGLIKFPGSTNLPNNPGPGSTVIATYLLNGQVIPGNGQSSGHLKIIVRQSAGIIQGVVLSTGNWNTFDPVHNSSNLNNIPTGTWYIVLSPQYYQGTDGQSRPDFTSGILTVQASLPGVDSNGRLSGLALAKLVIPSNSSAITSGMITDLRVYLSTTVNQLADALHGLGATASNTIDQQTTDLNFARTNFKIDSFLHASSNSLSNGIVNVLADALDVDTGLSTGWQLNSESDLTVKSGGAISGLVGYWKISEGSGTSIFDSSTFADAGTTSGGPVWGSGPVAGVASNALDFSNGSYISIPAEGALQNTLTTGAFSISAWVKLDTLLSGNGAVILASSEGSANLGNDGFVFMITNGIYLNIQKCFVANQFVAFPFSTGTWYHVVGVQNFVGGAPSTVSFYVNGIYIGDSSADSGSYKTISGGQPTYISAPGVSSASGLVAFPGSIAEVSVFNVALTSDQVSSIYSAVIVPTSGGATSFTVIDNAHTAASVPTKAMVVADGTSDLLLYASRNNGTTWTLVSNGVLTDISAQSSGTAMRYKVVGPNLSSVLNHVAMFWA